MVIDMRERGYQYDNRLKSVTSDSHGFTLVELIVVLTILAILAAATAPALLGYIDRAKENEALNNAKKIYMAAQTLADQAHTDLVSPEARVTTERVSEITQIDIPEGSKPYTIKYKSNSYDSANPTNAMYLIEEFSYEDGEFHVSFVRSTGEWEIIEK